MEERPRTVYVETGVGMAYDAGCAVWSFDPDLWGTCAQGLTVTDAMSTFTHLQGPATIVETIHGDEQAFARDHELATDEEVALTLDILADQRARALELLARTPPTQLQTEDPDRELPHWATWRSIQDMFWHICDTESRYYLPRCGLPPRERADTLQQELEQSATHVRTVLNVLPRGIVVQLDGEVWTSTKLLRRLAWHEAGELDVIAGLLTAK